MHQAGFVAVLIVGITGATYSQTQPVTDPTQGDLRKEQGDPAEKSVPPDSHSLQIIDKLQPVYPMVLIVGITGATYSQTQPVTDPTQGDLRKEQGDPAEKSVPPDSHSLQIIDKLQPVYPMVLIVGITGATYSQTQPVTDPTQGDLRKEQGDPAEKSVPPDSHSLQIIDKLQPVYPMVLIVGITGATYSQTQPVTDPTQGDLRKEQGDPAEKSVPPDSHSLQIIDKLQPVYPMVLIVGITRAPYSETQPVTDPAQGDLRKEQGDPAEKSVPPDSHSLQIIDKLQPVYPIDAAEKKRQGQVVLKIL